MRVVSFNIRYDNVHDQHRWSEREPLCTRLILELAPDVLGLQEGLQHQVEDVRRALPDHDIVWAGRDDGGVHGEACPVFFRKLSFRLVDSGHFWLSSTPGVPGSRSWDTACPRMCTFVVLETRANLRVLVMNTHMDHVSAEARARGAELVAERAAALEWKYRCDAVAVMGDFNEASGSAPYRTLVAAGLVDAWQPGSEAVASFHDWKGPRRSDERIDWILSRGKLQSVRSFLATSKFDSPFWPSDHFPLVVDLK